MRIILIIIVLFDYIRPFFNRLSNSKPVCKTGPLYVAMTVHMYFWSISVQVVCICINIDIYVHFEFYYIASLDLDMVFIVYI